MPLPEHTTTSTDWDQLYRERHTPWDKGRPAPPLLEWIGANPGTLGGRVLVPGCGLGHDARAIAALSGVDELVGLDLSPEAVSLATAFPKTGGERFVAGSFFDLAPEHRGTYDWIWEHTCFCAIDPERRDDYAASAFDALRPGGHLLGVFYLDPYDDEHQPGAGPPHGCSLEELESRFVQTGAFERVESYIPAVSYPGREGLERVVRLRKA
ncbi:MAG TPA: methyltransferase domain-containing protein [Bacteroidia bacterium]|nr:methyltransferase domain-containing protein [Bacteroidia bacterium]